MAFQFLCPQGHLLQAEESQAGQQCKCPYCESLFFIPQPSPPTSAPGQPATQQPGPLGAAYQEPEYQEPIHQDPAPPGPTPEAFPGIRTGSEFPGQRAPDEGPVDFTPPSAAEQPILHILCPSGHELETPREMLGQDAMCPYCQAQFKLRFEDSLEYKQQQADERRRRESQLGQTWMYWSIAAAVAVVLGVIVMIVVAAS